MKPILILVLVAVFRQNDAARILAVFPIPSLSHQVVFRPLIYELAKRGHELVVITTDTAYPDGNIPENVTELCSHDESYQLWKEGFVKKVNGGTTMLEILETALTMIIEVFEFQLKTKEVQNLIKSNERFDLLLVEATARSTLVMSHVFKAPIIQISTFGMTVPTENAHGIPSHAILYPDMLSRKVHDLSILDKIELIYFKMRLNYMFWKLEEKENSMIKRVFGPNAPNINELSDNVDMFFVNMHRIWEGNRPVPPSVIHLGGLHITPDKPLPKDLKSFLDKSVTGIIYMSFGTNVQPSLLPPEKIKVFTNVFAKLPYDILLKWDKDEIIGKPKNMKLFKWLPQKELLKHPNIKLFICQGGLQSTDESIMAGVPMIGFPMLADQWFNAEKYEYFNIGFKLDIATVTEDVLENAINTIIGDDRYRSNVVKLRTKMYDQPQSSLERAVWWTEHVLRHGGARHLRAPAANIGWSEYLVLDIGAIAAFILLTISIASYYSFRLFIRPITNDCKANTEKKNH